MTNILLPNGRILVFFSKADSQIVGSVAQVIAAENSDVEKEIRSYHFQIKTFGPLFIQIPKPEFPGFHVWEPEHCEYRLATADDFEFFGYSLSKPTNPSAEEFEEIRMKNPNQVPRDPRFFQVSE